MVCYGYHSQKTPLVCLVLHSASFVLAPAVGFELLLALIVVSFEQGFTPSILPLVAGLLALKRVGIRVAGPALRVDIGAPS